LWVGELAVASEEEAEGDVQGDVQRPLFALGRKGRREGGDRDE